MSKVVLVIGVVLSTGLHAWMLTWNIKGLFSAPNQASSQARTITAIDVVDVPMKAQQLESVQASIPKVPDPLPEPPPPQPKPAVAQVQPEPLPQPKAEPLTPPRTEPLDPPKAPKPVPTQAKGEPKPQAPPPARSVPMEEIKRPQSVTPTKVALAPGGDLAGASEGAAEPSVRIQWGSSDHAMAVMRATQMKLVTVGPDLQVRQELTCDASGRWQRGPIRVTGPVTYSNGLRIVDEVPAFSQIRGVDLIRSGERLAVLVPVQIERLIEQAKAQAASKAGLSMKQVSVFGGSFQIEAGRVTFMIEKIHERG